MKHPVFLGIDIGGTKTAVAIADNDGTLHASGRIRTIHGEDPETYIGRIRNLAEELLAEIDLPLSKIHSIGISAPGPLRVDTGMMLKPPNNPGWENIPITRLILDAFEKDTHLNNDANAGVLAEYHFGQHRNCRNMVYLTCSTGIGSGIIADGTLVQGTTDMGGEIGHMVLDPDGPACPCGLRGCLELYCGGLSVARRVQEDIRAGLGSPRLLELADGCVEDINFIIIEKAIREEDAYALQVWDRYIEHLAHAIGTLIMTLNPERIFLGTIGLHMADLLLDALRERVKRYAWSWNSEACIISPTSLDKTMGELSAIAVARNAWDESPQPATEMR